MPANPEVPQAARQTCVYQVNRSGSTRWSRFQPCGKKAVVLDTMPVHLAPDKQEWHCRRHSIEAFAERAKESMERFNAPLVARERNEKAIWQEGYDKARQEALDAAAPMVSIVHDMTIGWPASEKAEAQSALADWNKFKEAGK